MATQNRLLDVAKLPHVVGQNGIRIPLQPHQDGILHRFATPENRLFIKHTSETNTTEPDKLVIEGEADPALKAALQENTALQASIQAQADQMRQMQEQMAQMQALLAQAAKPVVEATPRGRSRKSAVADTPTAADTPVVAEAASQLAPPVL